MKKLTNSEMREVVFDYVEIRNQLFNIFDRDMDFVSEEELDLIDDICFNAVLCTRLNKGIAAYRIDGSLIGKYANQIETSLALGIPQSQVNLYLNNKMKSRKFRLEYCPYYVVEDIEGESNED